MKPPWNQCTGWKNWLQTRIPDDRPPRLKVPELEEELSDFERGCDRLLRGLYSQPWSADRAPLAERVQARKGGMILRDRQESLSKDSDSRFDHAERIAYLPQRCRGRGGCLRLGVRKRRETLKQLGKCPRSQSRRREQAHRCCRQR